MKKKNDFESGDYDSLLKELRQVIAEAAAKGVSFAERDDCLTCRACGAYEGVLSGGERVVFKEQVRTPHDWFIIIDRKERSTRRNGFIFFKITYRFICTACGAEQEEVVREKFEE